MYAKIPERHLLDILARIDHVTNYTRHFGLLLGNEPKIPDAKLCQLFTLFAYGTHLGPYQTARHLSGLKARHDISHVQAYLPVYG